MTRPDNTTLARLSVCLGLNSLGYKQLREFDWGESEPSAVQRCEFAAGYVQATLANFAPKVEQISKEWIAMLLEKLQPYDADRAARVLVKGLKGATTEHVPAIRDALRAGQWERPEPPKGTDLHPLLPYARAVADKLRETWPWHTFSDEMILPVLETGEPGVTKAPQMAHRLAHKLQIGDALQSEIMHVLVACGWDEGITRFPTLGTPVTPTLGTPVTPTPGPILATSDVLPLHDARRLRLEAFAMRAPAAVLPVFFDSTAGVAPTDQNCRHAYAAAAWAWAQAMIDAEPKS